jgi:hypothetical protein
MSYVGENPASNKPSPSGANRPALISASAWRSPTCALLRSKAVGDFGLAGPFQVKGLAQPLAIAAALEDLGFASWSPVPPLHLRYA